MPNRSEGNIDSVEVRYRRPMTITVSSLVQMARHCPNLEFLCLGSALMPDTMYLETGDYRSTLQPGSRVGLTYVAMTAADGAKALGDYCPKLHKLLMAGCEWVTVDEVRAFLTHCRRLQTLDLRHCGKLDSRLGRLFMVKNGSGGNAAAGYENEAKDNDLPSTIAIPSIMGFSCAHHGIHPASSTAGSESASMTAVATESPPSPLDMLLMSTTLSNTCSNEDPVQDGAMFNFVNKVCQGRLRKSPAEALLHSLQVYRQQQERRQQLQQQHQQQHQQQQVYNEEYGYGLHGILHQSHASDPSGLQDYGLDAPGLDLEGEASESRLFLALP
ncbi:hypothetical protein EDD11_003402 [Mortierella claussenii]|nr:hypothetical protein EDD11_003402 [Mortierella claussenii]